MCACAHLNLATKMNSSKVNRKVKRKQAQFLKQEPDTDLRFQEDPSMHIFIGNGGLKNGVPREILENMLTTHLSGRRLKHLYLPPGKDYALATFTDPAAANECLNSLNGACIQNTYSIPKSLPPALLHGPPVHLFMSFIDKIPPNIFECNTTDSDQLPPGLLLVEDFVSIEEEKELLCYFSFAPDDKKLTTEVAVVVPSVEPLATVGEHTPPTSSLKHRQVMHFGYEFLYGSNLVDPGRPLPGGLPPITRPLLDRMIEKQLTGDHPDQLTVNKYNPGSGIPLHVDTHSVFQGPIFSLSLQSQVVMEFKNPINGIKIPVALPPRSLLVMTGESRYLWSHGIPARTWDEIGARSLGDHSGTPHQRNLIPRGTRISLTFRRVRRQPSVCTCDYPLQCDYQNSSSTQDKLN